MNNLVPPINIMHEFFTPEDPAYKFYSSNGIDDYLLNDKLHTCEDENGFISKEMSEHLYDQYMLREGVFKHKDSQKHLIMFDKYGNDISDKSKRDKLHDKTNVYSLVISLRDDISLNNDIGAIAQKTCDVFFKQFGIKMGKYGVDPKYFNYRAVIHKNTENHHIHIKMYQTEETPNNKIVKKGKIPEIVFAATKVIVAKELNGMFMDTEKMDTATAKYKAQWIKFEKNRMANLQNPTKAFKEDPRDKMRKLAKLQAGLYNLYKQQLDLIKFQDKYGKWIEKQGTRLTYESLSKPIHSLEQLEQINKDPKVANKFKKAVQPEQIELKKMIDAYVLDITKRDLELNAKSEQYQKYTSEFYKALNKQLNPSNEKNKDVKPYLDLQKQKRFDDMKATIGNMIIRDLASFNKINKNQKFQNVKEHQATWQRKKSSRIQNRISMGFDGRVQKEIHRMFHQNTNRQTFKLISFGSGGEFESFVKKELHRAELEKMAAEQGISLKELEDIIKKSSTLKI